MNVKKVGIVGCGVMGSGIAQLCAQADYEVLVSDLNDESLKKGMSSLDLLLANRVKKGKLAQQDKDALLSRIKGTTNVNDFHDRDLIIEAVVENMDVKRKIFGELDKVCSEHAILATNTGSLSVIDIARATNRPDKVIGMHFFNPPQVMKLVELVKATATSKDTLRVGREFCASIGKTVVVAPDAPGFLVNRLLAPLTLNAIRMLEAGIATREDIDTAVKLGASMAMGPLERADLIGLDVVLAGYEIMYQKSRNSLYAPPTLLKEKVSAGRLGRKTGKGFYEYQTED